MKLRYKKYLSLIVLLLVIGVFFLPFRIPYAFRATAIVYPVKKWCIKSDQDGNFVGELKNFKTGLIKNITNYKFERGDIASLSLLPVFKNNTFIQQNDTFGYIRSMFVEEKIQKFDNLILVEEAQLISSRTGEKASVVESLLQRLQLSKQQYGLCMKNYERALILFQDSVIPPNEFDNFETEYNNAFTNVNIARSEYESAKTGEKPEEIRLIREKINSYKKELAFYKYLESKYVLTSPFSGKVVIDLYSYNPEEFLCITDTSDYLLYALVKFNHRPYMNFNTNVEFRVPSTETMVTAHIFEISNNVDIIDSRQIVFTMAQIDNPSDLIFPGLTVQCKFICDTITLWEYSKRTLNIFIR